MERKICILVSRRGKQKQMQMCQSGYQNTVCVRYILRPTTELHLMNGVREQIPSHDNTLINKRTFDGIIDVFA